MDDIFDALSGPGVTVDAPTKKFGGNKVDYWKVEHVPPVEIDVTDMGVDKKSFAIHTFPSDDIPTKYHERVISVAKVLFSKGWTFRHTGGGDCGLQNEVMELPDAKVSSYMAWKTFNTDVTFTPHKNEANRYGIVSKYRGKVTGAIRFICAAVVDSILGRSQDERVGLVLGYSESGIESTEGRYDYKTTSYFAFPVMIATEANVVVLNIKNDSAVTRLAELIKKVDEDK